MPLSCRTLKYLGVTLKLGLILQTVRCINKFKTSLNKFRAIPVLTRNISSISHKYYFVGDRNVSLKEFFNRGMRISLRLSQLTWGFSFRLWNVDTTRVYEKWQITNILTISLFCFKLVDDATINLFVCFLNKDSI